MIMDYIERARKAQQILVGFNQGKIDAIVRAIAKVVYDNADD